MTTPEASGARSLSAAARWRVRACRITSWPSPIRTLAAARAAVPGMVTRGEGTIINVSGMLAFSGPAFLEQLALRRAVYTGTLAHLLALSQALHEELKPYGLRVQVLCPGVVATEFHQRQGLDLSTVQRMSADDVVTASLRGLELGEVVCAPGVDQSGLLDAVFHADLAAFEAQAPHLAARYQAS